MNFVFTTQKRKQKKKTNKQTDATATINYWTVTIVS